MTRTALVLGGGGVTGIAWELGILKGLSDAGLDLTDADLVIGTSAGSVVGAQVTTGQSLDVLYDAQLRGKSKELPPRLNKLLLPMLVPAVLVPGSTRGKRQRIGLLSLAARRPGGTERIDVIRSRVRAEEWPDRDLKITAVAATSGRLEVFDRSSGVGLVEAVAASCAVPFVWPAITIDGTHYVDGGLRSTANADLAQGADRVVVLAPIPRSLSRGSSIRAQLERTGATHTAVVTPDEAARADIGKNVLDPGKRADAARAGLRQAPDVLEQVAAVWR